MFTAVVLACLSLGPVLGGRLPARIVGGQDTDTGTHPHQVSLEYSSTGTSFSHICGGSLIASRWVLTAAHCVDHAGYDATKFRIGVNNGKLDDPNKTQYGIIRIIPHENYDSSNAIGRPAFPNDIALIELNGDVGGPHSPISLMETNSLDGMTCTISGWGYTEVGTGTKVIPNVLQQTTGTILTKSQCESQWNTIFFPSYSHNVHVCIHNTATGSCNGDSGGPMVCNGKLAGVTSWGASGCDTTKPSVYVRVPNFVSWINGKMASRMTPTLF